MSPRKLTEETGGATRKDARDGTAAKREGKNWRRKKESLLNRAEKHGGRRDPRKLDRFRCHVREIIIALEFDLARESIKRTESSPGEFRRPREARSALSRNGRSRSRMASGDGPRRGSHYLS